MRRRALSVFFILTLLITLLGCSKNDIDTSGSDASNNISVIEVTSIDGKTSSVDLSELTFVTGNGGFKKSTGTIVGPGELSGPRLLDVLALAGGIEKGQAVELTANDGYKMTLTYEQVNGHILTYDEEGQAITLGGVEAIIAVDSSDDELIEAPPRIAFIGDAITDGHFWVRDIGEIKITSTPGEWEINLTGIRNEVLDRSTFESLATCPDTPHPGQKWETTDKDGEKVTYEGAPLWVVLSMIDGEEEGHFRFNRELSREGYKIQVIAKDGYLVELESQDVAYNDGIFLAYLKNGKPLAEGEGPLQLVGPNLPSKQHSVREISEIKLVLP